MFVSYRRMSKMDFTPAETKPTGQRVSSCRSAETSIATTRGELNRSPVNTECNALFSPPRCTPPSLEISPQHNGIRSNVLQLRLPSSSEDLVGLSRQRGEKIILRAP